MVVAPSLLSSVPAGSLLDEGVLFSLALPDMLCLNNDMSLQKDPK